MELVFIHGWGFDAGFWDALSPLLPEYRQQRIDLGFYGQSLPEFPAHGDCILIGHSLGFVHGMKQKQNWKGWIAINSFPRFVRTPSQAGCVASAQLREMNIGLGFAPARALQAFHKMVGTTVPSGIPDIGRLRAGLDELRDADISDISHSHIPLLVLASRNDPLVPPETSEALGSINAQFDVLWHDSGGHVLPLNDPAWCAKSVGRFMQTHFG